MRMKGDLLADNVTAKAIIIERSTQAVITERLKTHHSVSITASAKRFLANRVVTSRLKSRGVGGRTISLHGFVRIKGKVIFEKVSPVNMSFLELSALELGRAGRSWQHVGENVPNGHDAVAVDAVQWTRMSKNDVSEVLLPTRSICSGVGHFLGGPCSLGPHTAVATHIPTSQPHSQLHLTALMHYFGLWTGETLYAKVDGEYVWTNTHRQGGAGSALLGCGAAELGDPLDLYLPHSAATATIEFGSLSKRHACNQSWALGHALIEVR